jgi:eukaryotic-like serine/threonine-protein kinase
MSGLTIPNFLGQLQAYRLVTEVQLSEIKERGKRFADVQALARELIRRDWLTPYQANQLLQGKGENLVLGPYRLLERLGTGAMGDVFKARHLRMDRIVALKVVHNDLLDSPRKLERFSREARAAAQLSHPNIIVAHDADAVGNIHFLAMEYVEGIDLSRRVHESGPLPIGQACEFIRQAALGLQHAFERGVIHRDIKPGNLMVTRVSAHAPPVVKILDFGLARFASESSQVGRMTQFGHMVGTIDYIAPEQAENARTADTRADIYSLGCSLYFILTGQPPFEGSDVVEKVTARIENEPPSARAVRAEVPIELDRVIARMMARDPARRYGTPAEVVAALEPFARHEEQSLIAVDESPAWSKWVWIAVVVGSLLLIVLLLFFGPRRVATREASWGPQTEQLKETD